MEVPTVWPMTQLSIWSSNVVAGRSLERLSCFGSKRSSWETVSCYLLLQQWVLNCTRSIWDLLQLEAGPRRTPYYIYDLSSLLLGDFTRWKKEVFDLISTNLLLRRFPFVRTDQPDHFRHKENSSFNQNYPVRSVKSYLHTRRRWFFSKAFGKNYLPIFKLAGPAGQIWQMENTLITLKWKMVQPSLKPLDI